MSIKLYIVGCMLVMLSSCTDGDQTVQRPVLRADTMDNSEVVVALPEAAGKELVEMSCVPCHSLRYIEMQPDMPKKSWEKIVTKMIKNYGAPVRDSIAAAQIVDYLTEIKGTK